MTQLHSSTTITEGQLASCPLLDQQTSSSASSASSSPQQYYSTRQEQEEDVKRLRQFVAQRQVDKWQEEANTPLLNTSIKFQMLLAEGCRHEIENIRKRRGTRYANLDSDAAKQLEADVKRSYGRLIREGVRMFQERRRHGFSDQQLHQIGGQAISSYSSMYPWSDGIVCQDITPAHPHYTILATRRCIDEHHHTPQQLQSGSSSSYVVMTSFMAANLCSQAKLQAATEKRQQRMKPTVVTCVAAHVDPTAPPQKPPTLSKPAPAPLHIRFASPSMPIHHGKKNASLHSNPSGILMSSPTSATSPMMSTAGAASVATISAAAAAARAIGTTAAKRTLSAC